MTFFTFSPFWIGVGIGLYFAFAAGPGVVLQLNHSLAGNPGRAIAVSVGMLFGDFFWTAVCILGMDRLPVGVLHGLEAKITGTAGAFFLIFLGLKTPTAPKVDGSSTDFPTRATPMLREVLLGATLNLANPIMATFWSTTIGGFRLQVKPDEFQSHALSFVTGTLLSAFAMDTIRNLLTHKARNFLSSGWRRKSEMLLQRALALLGIAMIWRIWTGGQ